MWPKSGNHWNLAGEQTIAVARDAHGVPHVRAKTEADLYRGLGNCHARDRGLQILLMRILGQGRAGEFLRADAKTLVMDTFFRRLNLLAGVDRQLAILPAPQLRLLQAYCDGINAVLRRQVPWELRMLGYRPSDWMPADTLLMVRMVAYLALAQSQGDIERLLIEWVQAGVPRGHLEALFPGRLARLDWGLLAQVRLGSRVLPPEVRFNPALPRLMNSNNWVLSGRKTASGTPILANDPHLETNRLPAVWYEAVLEQDEHFCIAVTIPGIPAALLGRTRHLAWGATYTFMDSVDSWIEDCRDGRYRRIDSAGQESWLPFRVRTEIIRRKKLPEVTLTCFENDHGLLAGDPRQSGMYLASSWAGGTSMGTASVVAMLSLPHAETVEAGRELLGQLEPSFNWVLADRQGNIGYQMSGRMPKRNNDWNGFVPLAGWDPENDWQGFVDFHDLPRALNPECGFLVTANNDLNALGRTAPINLSMGSYRADRITELLAGRDDWTVAATQAMQMDDFSPQAARYLEILKPLLPAGELGDVLRAWDYRYHPLSKGATLFERFYQALVKDVFGRVCGGEVLDFLWAESGILINYYSHFDRVLLAPENAWFGGETRDSIYRRVAAESLVGPIERWGDTQRIHFKHQLFDGKLPGFLGFDFGPVPVPGGRATIHQCQSYRFGGHATSFAPSFRMVCDLADDAAHTSLAGGPSDRRFSGLYTTGLADWLAGRLKLLKPS